MPRPASAQSHMTPLRVITKVELPYHTLTRSIMAPLTRLQIEADYLWGATLVEIRYLIREKELIDSLCWLHAEATRIAAAGVNADNEKLAQIHRLIESYTRDLHQVWNNIAKLCGTYLDSDDE
jgi:hypothetical protein